jgi:hypothetical protein
MALASPENREQQIGCFVIFAFKYWRLENKKCKLGQEKTMEYFAHKP